VNPENPAQGLLFDGRLAEDFKLSTGTWVNVGPLRAQIIRHLAPLVQDIVISGHDRDAIGILIFANIDACRRLTNGAHNAPPSEILADPALIREIHARLKALAAQSTGSSTRVCRAMLLIEPPSLDVGEITDKGTINQRTVLMHRATLVEILHA